MRTFHETTTARLACKPVSLDEAKTCRLHGEDLASVELVELIGPVTIGQLDALVAQRAGATLEFAVLDQSTRRVYLVNTEGYDYTRYLGRFTAKDARALVAAHSA